MKTYSLHVKRTRRLLLTPIITLLLIASLTAISPVSAAESNSVYVDPQTTTAAIGGNFTVVVNATDVTLVNSYEIRLDYDTTILDCTDVVVGDFITGTTLPYDTIDDPAGRVTFGMLNLNSTAYVNGTGVLGTINFTVTGEGWSELNIGEWDSGPGEPHNWLIDTAKDQIPHDSYSGSFNNVPNDPPIANFTMTPDPPTAGENVTLNGTLSTDPDGSIVSWEWAIKERVGGGEIPVADLSGAVVNYTFPEGKKYTVTLTVTDDGTPPLTDSLKKEANVSRPSRDVAVTAVLSSHEKAVVGDIPIITALLVNLGTSTETFNLVFTHNTTQFYNTTLTLPSGNTTTVTPGWNTTGLTTGTYTITVNATLADVNPANNYKTTSVKVVWNDVSVTRVDVPEKGWVESGRTERIDVTAKNEGGVEETFSIKLSYDSTVIDTKTMTLEPGLANTTDFLWNTLGVAAGNYTITAEAVPANDDDTTNNLQTATLEVRKASLTIFIEVSPLEISAGEEINISGSVEPRRVLRGKELTVQYETTGGTWTDITTVTVDENDEYSYVWKPEEAGNYSVRVAWPGDAAVSSAVSPEKDVTVAAAPVDILLYAVIAVVVIAAAVVVVVYFVKMRKPKPA